MTSQRLIWSSTRAFFRPIASKPKISFEVLDKPTHLAISSRVYSASCYNHRLLSPPLNNNIQPLKEQKCGFFSDPKFVPTTADLLDEVELTNFQHFKIRLGFKKGMLKFSYKHLRRNAADLYKCHSVGIDTQYFIKELQLRDTLNSWFLIHELHLWMICVRLAQLGHDGNFIKIRLLEIFWEDVNKRISEMLEGKVSGVKQESLRIFNDHLKHSFVMYDEGLLTDDKVLAGSVWNMMHFRREVDPKVLETTVAYIRKQTLYLDIQEDMNILRGRVSYLPLYGNESPQDWKRSPKNIEIHDKKVKQEEVKIA